MQKTKKVQFLTLFTITVFIALASIDNAVLEMASGIYWAIIDALDSTEFGVGLANSVLVWVTSVTSVIWAYAGDRDVIKGGRKRLLLYGTIIWSASLAFTPLITSIGAWILLQCIAGVGLGSISSVGFSVLTDLVSPEHRGIAFSFFGMSQMLGSGAGKSFSALVVMDASRWHLPFFLTAIAGFLLLLLYIFTINPTRGSQEEEFKDLNYEHVINIKELGLALKKPTNVLVFAIFFFGSVTLGAITWLPYVYTSMLPFAGGSIGIIGFFLVIFYYLGGFVSIPLGHLGDNLKDRSPSSRALFCMVGFFGNIPFFIWMLSMPLDLAHFSSVADSGPVDIILLIANLCFTNPAFLGFAIVSFISTGIYSGVMPNIYALGTEVNVPEHRGTVYSGANLLMGIARGIGYLFIPLVAGMFGNSVAFPGNYILSLMASQGFFVISGFLSVILVKMSPLDIRNTKALLRSRAEQAKKKGSD